MRAPTPACAVVRMLLVLKCFWCYRLEIGTRFYCTAYHALKDFHIILKHVEKSFVLRSNILGLVTSHSITDEGL